MRLDAPRIVVVLISFVPASPALLPTPGLAPAPHHCPLKDLWLATNAHPVLLVGNLVRGA